MRAIIKLAVTCVSLVPMASAVEAPAVREVPTHQDVAAALFRQGQEKPTQAEDEKTLPDPSVDHRPQNLLERADMLCYRGYATLVPKRAILQIPATMADRLGARPGVKLISWPDFYAMNRSWIGTQEVTRAQSLGKESFDPELRTQMVKSGNLIVATYQTGPISVIPVSVPEEIETAKP